MDLRFDFDAREWVERTTAGVKRKLEDEDSDNPAKRVAIDTGGKRGLPPRLRTDNLPAWWLRNNVRIVEEHADVALHLEILDEPFEVDHTIPPTPVQRPRYQIEKSIFRDALQAVSGWLMLPASHLAGNFAACNSHFLLHSPHDGCTYFLDAVVDCLVKHMQADLVRVDALDLVDIGGDCLGESSFRASKDCIRNLVLSSHRSTDLEEGSDEDEEQISDEEAEGDDSDTPSDDDDDDPDSPGGNSWMRRYRRPIRLRRLLRKMVDASVVKRTQITQNIERASKVVIHVRDYDEFESTTLGCKILEGLRTIVNARRKRGHMVLLLATKSNHQRVLLSTSDVKCRKSERTDKAGQVMVVKPSLDHSSESVFTIDKALRFKQINCRHIRTAMRGGFDDESCIKATSALLDWSLPSFIGFNTSLGDSVWTFGRVHRIALAAIGHTKIEKAIGPADLKDIIAIADHSDSIRAEWTPAQSKTQELPTPALSSKKKPSKPSPISTARMKELRETCNKYEKSMLEKVTDPANITVSFSDVQVPRSTIDTIYNLITLPLLQPEAFASGVLANNKISGVLLYGPPGNGKTLLAKAVAKQCDATVLEVSGADAYQKYVGEGEKVVQAVFSLARKLSPCVVFLDEADAMFHKRSANDPRHQRSMINQFLREWDGLSGNNKESVLVMAATNRPFDVDNAILRRLPRRIFLDLPTIPQMEGILKIHLKDEQLAPDVRLADIARSTTYFSGSDLKNLCVAAALACVREETQQAGNDTNCRTSSSKKLGWGDESGANDPLKRVLQKRHFDAARREICPSHDEDLLAKMREFDRQYANRTARPYR